MGYVCGAMEATFEEDGWDDYRIDGNHLATCILLGDNLLSLQRKEMKKGQTSTSYYAHKPGLCSIDLSLANGGNNFV